MNSSESTLKISVLKSDFHCQNIEHLQYLQKGKNETDEREKKGKARDGKSGRFKYWTYLAMLQAIGAGDRRLIAGWICQEDKLGCRVCARHFSLTTYLALFEGCSSINVAYLRSNNSKTRSPTFPTIERRALLSPNFISLAPDLKSLCRLPFQNYDTR